MFLRCLRIFAKVVAGLVIAVVLAVILFIALFFIEDMRLKHEVASINAWIAAELPVGSTVPDTMRIVRSHGVKEECLFYDERERLVGACYRHANRWYEPIEAFIAMNFWFNEAGHLERSSVDLSYTFL